jgi:transposase, IS30 family
MGWSPEQIAGRMELEGSEHVISTESIYRHAYSPGGRRAGLPRLLAQRKPRRGRRRRNGAREPAIPNRTPIHQRPTKAHLRSQFGHWEGDLMHFRRQRDILLTLQERRSRLTLARRLLSKDADGTADAIAAELSRLPTGARRTITHDNGGEFARHEAVTNQIGLRAYFCDPHSPWQRGSIENANGRLRRDLPRKTSLGGYSDADIDDVIWNLVLCRTRLPCETGAATRHPQCAGRRRGMDRWNLGYDGPMLSMIVPVFSSDLNGYMGFGLA